MKRNRILLYGTLCLVLGFFLLAGQDCLAKSPFGKVANPKGDEKPAYVNAYTEFLLDEDINQGQDFPIRGYYLFDLNFDGTPELGILHDSWGSVGGYFTYYYYDGEKIAEILDENGEPARASNYTQVLADFDTEKIYLLKEMYLLQGNMNGTYGYVREIRWDGQVPCVYYILDLQVVGGGLDEPTLFVQHEHEDEFLKDRTLESRLQTRRYQENEWINISSKEYLKRKRKLIPEENAFVDIRRLDLNYLGGPDLVDNGDIVDVRMSKKEIEQLLGKFEKNQEDH